MPVCAKVISSLARKGLNMAETYLLQGTVLSAALVVLVSLVATL